jgi:hypothetical protein
MNSSYSDYRSYDLRGNSDEYILSELAATSQSVHLLISVFIIIIIIPIVALMRSISAPQRARRQKIATEMRFSRNAVLGLGGYNQVSDLASQTVYKHRRSGCLLARLYGFDECFESRSLVRYILANWEHTIALASLSSCLSSCYIWTLLEFHLRFVKYLQCQRNEEIDS